MSRIGKKEIVVPQKTEVLLQDGILTVKGPLGEISRPMSKKVSMKNEDGKITLTVTSPSDNAIWGTSASHLKNMIEGTNQGFQKKLQIEGVGYKSELKGNELVLALGFSHPVNVKIPEGIKVVVEKNTITISGVNKESVGEFAAKVRDLKKPEPYKGKGIKYEGEVIKIKQGKKAVT